MRHTTTYYDLLDAFAQEGCPVCRLSLAAVRRYLEGIDYEGVNDTGFRAQTRAALGFCNQHSHQWLKQAHVLGTALIYEDILSDLTAALKTLRHQKASLRESLASRLTMRRDEAGGLPGLMPTGDCLACRTRTEEERILLAVLVDSLREAAFREGYLGSMGVCLPHLREALRVAPNDEVFRMLCDHAVTEQERMVMHLREVVRKHDYRYRDEVVGQEERDAASRSVAHVAGALGVR